MLRLYSAEPAYNGGPLRYLLRRNGVALLPEPMNADQLTKLARDRRVAEDVRLFITALVVI